MHGRYRRCVVTHIKYAKQSMPPIKPHGGKPPCDGCRPSENADVRAMGGLPRKRLPENRYYVVVDFQLLKEPNAGATPRTHGPRSKDMAQ